MNLLDARMEIGEELASGGGVAEEGVGAAIDGVRKNAGGGGGGR